MEPDIQTLREAMEKAAADMDFEEAARLRNRINLLRLGADPESASHADTAGLVRQQPGRMGLGTGRQSVEPPDGWKPPAKPDPMTTGVGKRKR